MKRKLGSIGLSRSAYCESYMQDIKTVVLEIRVFDVVWRVKTVLSHSVFFLKNSEISTTSWT